MATIAGLFPDRASAESAISELNDAGFDRSQIGFVGPRGDQAEVTDEATGDRLATSTTGAVTGAAIGGTLGAILAATGALVIPGIGPFIAGGILATSLVAGAAGWLVGGLVGLGIPREEAEYYQGRVERGGYLVTVNAAGREDDSYQILLRHGAEDVRDRGWGYTNANTNAAAAVDPTTSATAPIAQTHHIVYSDGQSPNERLQQQQGMPAQQAMPPSGVLSGQPVPGTTDNRSNMMPSSDYPTEPVQDAGAATTQPMQPTQPESAAPYAPAAPNAPMTDVTDAGYDPNVAQPAQPMPGTTPPAVDENGRVQYPPDRNTTEGDVRP